MEPIAKLSVEQKPRHTMLPLLVVLFLISYALLTTLVILQDRTIDSQKNLIHLLFKDNLHLLATRIGAHKQAETLPSIAQQTPSAKVPSTQVQGKQTPQARTQSAEAKSLEAQSREAESTESQSNQVPVIQAKPDPGVKAGQKSRKAQKAPHSRPPVEVTDPSDTRRAAFSI